MCMLQGTLCNTGFPRNFYGGNICSVGKDISNFVLPAWKFDNPYYNKEDTSLICQLLRPPSNYLSMSRLGSLMHISIMRVSPDK